MKFYKRFPGDITIKTGHLSPAEFGVYDRLLDHYYATERPLPASLDDCCSIARTRSRDDRKAVERVLGEFFTLSTAGWEQQRAEEMIAEAQPKIEAARTNGKKGGRPKKKPTGTEPKPTGFANGTEGQTETVDSEKASQSQSTSSPTSKKKRGDTPLKPPSWVRPEWVPSEPWSDFETHRKAMRGIPFTDAARDGVVGDLRKLCDAGHDAAEMLTTAITRGWRTVYPPKTNGMNGHAVNRQEAIEARNSAVGDRWLLEQEAMDASR